MRSLRQLLSQRQYVGFTRTLRLHFGDISPMANSCTTADCLAVRRPLPKAALVDPQRANLRFERRARNAEPCRRPGRSVDPAVTGAQRVLDDRLLLCRKRAG